MFRLFLVGFSTILMFSYDFLRNTGFRRISYRIFIDFWGPENQEFLCFLDGTQCKLAVDNCNTMWSTCISCSWQPSEARRPAWRLRCHAPPAGRHTHTHTPPRSFRSFDKFHKFHKFHNSHPAQTSHTGKYEPGTSHSGANHSKLVTVICFSCSWMDFAQYPCFPWFLEKHRVPKDFL